MHVRGYVERPQRVERLKEALLASGWFTEQEPQHYPDHVLTTVHLPRYVEFLRTCCLKPGLKKAVYPYTLPVHRPGYLPPDVEIQAGYYALDTFTPLDAPAYHAAVAAAHIALTGADCLLAGRRLAYALCRPPGHHAESSHYGGFCYFNNSALAAHHLSQQGRVAMLDIDFHHGNGAQEIFYDRADVLTISLHGDPAFAYPYFSGFADEIGAGPGLGHNRNFPLPDQCSAETYLTALDQALGLIGRFQPDFLVIPLGLDTALRDPTGGFTLRRDDFACIGARIAQVALPTLVVQEGGYNLRRLGEDAHSFFAGLLAKYPHQ